MQAQSALLSVLLQRRAVAHLVKCTSHHTQRPRFKTHPSPPAGMGSIFVSAGAVLHTVSPSLSLSHLIVKKRGGGHREQRAHYMDTDPAITLENEKIKKKIFPLITSLSKYFLSGYRVPSAILKGLVSPKKIKIPPRRVHSPTPISLMRPIIPGGQKATQKLRGGVVNVPMQQSGRLPMS